MKKPVSWYKPGKLVNVRDKMQQTSYRLSAPYGKINVGISEKYRGKFTPHYTPQQMLNMGVFEGKYLNDCHGEFPREWYTTSAKHRTGTNLPPDTTLNRFGVKSRLSLAEWRARGWIPVNKHDIDIRGWFQWYCRYFIGRRCPHIDQHQIGRWIAFKRHSRQVELHGGGDLTRRRRQRQALLQWAWNVAPDVKK